MNKQRLDYSEGKLSLERQKKLEELDIIWNPRHLITEQWMKNFLAIQEYKNTHNHFPTISYIDKEGVRLGCWLAEQRNKYSSGKLLPEREKLSGILWQNFFTNKMDIFLHLKETLYIQGLRIFYLGKESFIEWGNYRLRKLNYLKKLI